MITFEEANKILHKYMKGDMYLSHSLAVSLIMRNVAKKIEKDKEEEYAVVGLLHDLDEEHCDWKNDIKVHGNVSCEILAKEGVNDVKLYEGIKAHNPYSGKKAETKMEYAVLASDPMSGFIKAVAQIYPDKKVANVKSSSVKKRLKEARFASGANRDYMNKITNVGITMDEFIDISLDAMKEFDFNS